MTGGRVCPADVDGDPFAASAPVGRAPLETGRPDDAAVAAGVDNVKNDAHASSDDCLYRSGMWIVPLRADRVPFHDERADPCLAESGVAQQRPLAALDVDLH